MDEYCYNLTCGGFDRSLLPKRNSIRKAFKQIGTEAYESTMKYSNPLGAYDFRKAVAENILPERGIECSKDNILATNGSLHAIFLFGLMLAQHHKKPVVAVEMPGYSGFRKTLYTLGISTLPLPIDREGAYPDENILSQCNAVILTPRHHFPTNITMSSSRRNDFYFLAKNKGILLIEDDYSRDFTFLGRNGLPLLSGKLRDDTMYIGSFSKNFAPGLRIGFVVAETEIINKLSKLRWRIDRHSPELVQVLLAELIFSGEYGRFVRQTRESYYQRWFTMKTLLQKYFGVRTERTGGLSFWLPMPVSWQTLEKIIICAESHGVCLTSGYDCFDNAPPNGVLRLGYASIENSQLSEAIELLGRSFSEVTGNSPHMIGKKDDNSEY